MTRIILFILLIVLGAILYVNRVAVVDWFDTTVSDTPISDLTKNKIPDSNRPAPAPEKPKVVSNTTTTPARTATKAVTPEMSEHEQAMALYKRVINLTD